MLKPNYFLESLLQIPSDAERRYELINCIIDCCGSAIQQGTGETEDDAQKCLFS